MGKFKFDFQKSSNAAVANANGRECMTSAEARNASRDTKPLSSWLSGFDPYLDEAWGTAIDCSFAKSKEFERLYAPLYATQAYIRAKLDAGTKLTKKDLPILDADGNPMRACKASAKTKLDGRITRTDANGNVWYAKSCGSTEPTQNGGKRREYTKDEFRAIMEGWSVMLREDANANAAEQREAAKAAKKAKTIADMKAKLAKLEAGE